MLLNFRVKDELGLIAPSITSLWSLERPPDILSQSSFFESEIVSISCLNLASSIAEQNEWLPHFVEHVA